MESRQKKKAWKRKKYMAAGSIVSLEEEKFGMDNWKERRKNYGEKYAKRYK